MSDTTDQPLYLNEGPPANREVVWQLKLRTHRQLTARNKFDNLPGYSPDDRSFFRRPKGAVPQFRRRIVNVEHKDIMDTVRFET